MISYRNLYIEPGKELIVCGLFPLFIWLAIVFESNNYNRLRMIALIYKTLVVMAVRGALALLRRPSLMFTIIFAAGMYQEEIIQWMREQLRSQFVEETVSWFNYLVTETYLTIVDPRKRKENRARLVILAAAGSHLISFLSGLITFVEEEIHNATLEPPTVTEEQIAQETPTVEEKPKEEEKPSEAERMIPGSDLIENVIPPMFQVDIYTAKPGDNKLYFAGVGFKTASRVVTAMHVVADAERVIFKQSVAKTEIEVDPKLFVETHVDLTWIELDQAQVSRLAASSAKLALSVPAKQWVRVISSGRMTFGHLEPIEAMGMLRYEGSTVRGFSGAPYHVNKLVYGVHVGAGTKQNFGFSASYLAALIRRYADPNISCQEDSAEYLLGQFRRYGMDSFDYEIAPNDPRSYTVEVGGSFHNIDAEVFDKLQEYHEARRTRGRVYQYESAREDAHFLGERHPEQVPDLPLAPPELLEVPKVEELSPTTRGFAVFPESTAGVSQLETRGNPTAQPDMVNPQLARLSDLITQNAQLLESLSAMHSSVMATPPPTLVPRSALSTTMSQNTSRPKGPTFKQKARQRIQALEEMVRRLTPPDQMVVLPERSNLRSSASAVGAVISPQPATLTSIST